MDKLRDRPPGLDRSSRAVVIVLALIAMITSFLPTQNPYMIISKLIETSREYEDGLETLIKLHCAYIYSKLVGWHLTPELISEYLYGSGENFDFRPLFLEGLQRLYINKGFSIDEDRTELEGIQFNLKDEIVYGSDMDRVHDFTQRLLDGIIPQESNYVVTWEDGYPVITYQVSWAHYTNKSIETSNELSNSLGDFGLRVVLKNYQVEDTPYDRLKRLIVTEGTIEYFDTYDWTLTNGSIYVHGNVGDVLREMGIDPQSLESLGINVNDMEMSLKDIDIAMLAAMGIANEFDLSAHFDISELPATLGIDFPTSKLIDLVAVEEG